MNPHINKIISTILLFFAIALQSQNSQLTAFTLDDGLPQSNIQDLIQDANGYLWVATQGGGIARFDGNKFEIWDENDGLISNYVHSLATINDKLFIGTNQGLSILDKQTFYNFDSSQINKVFSVDGAIYLATNEGIKIFEDTSIKHINIDSIIDSSVINDIVYNSKWFWIATNNGTYIVPKLETNPQVIKIDDLNTLVPNRDKKLIANKYIGLQKDVEQLEINKAIQDKSSNYWLATTKGLYKLTQNNFRHYYRTNTITAIHNSDNGIFVSTSDGGMIKMDSLGIHRIPNFHQIVYAINNNMDGQIFAGSDDGIFVLDSLKVVDTITVVKDVQRIMLKDSTIWVTALNNGITKFNYDFKNDSISNIIHFKKSDGIYDLDINDLQFDSQGRLWYISQRGYLGYIENDIVKHLGKKINYPATIGTLVVHDDKLFLGTHGKGIWWAKVSNRPKFRRLKGKKRLYSNNIYQLIFDDNNNLWSGTQKGIDKIKLDSLNQIVEVTHFGKNDGFIGIEAIQNVIEKDALGNIWFGTIRGLTTYEFEENKRDTIKPIIYFEKVEVVYNSVDTINLSDWTNSNKTLNLRPTDNHLSFTFKTVDINHPEEIRYRWRMNTTEWSSWSTDAKIVLASLDAGDFVFEAQSITANRIESTPIKFQFFIRTPLAKQLWFQITIACGVLLLMIFIFWLFLRNLKIKNKNKQHNLELKNHLLKMEQKALRLQMNPHFIFNVLNGVKAMGANDIKKMNTTINKFAALLRLTLDNSRQDSISLRKEISTLRNYIEVEQLMNEKSFKYVIYIDDVINADEVLIPPMLVQPFVENAIRHGILTVNRAGVLEISFSIKNNELHCSVQDNGIGFEQSKLKLVDVNHQSMALEVTKERIESLSGKDSFKIEELKDKENNVLGTIVTFKIPLLTDY